MDGWRPYELKLLPVKAWTNRRTLLCLSRRTHKSPTPYYTLASPALPKGDKFKPIDNKQIGDVSKFRLLSLFVSLYRIESGATYRQHQPWIESWIHPSLYGCLPRRECLDASWDTQADIEEALCTGSPIAVALLDYWKFFDSFEPNFVYRLMLAIGIDKDYAKTQHNLYSNLNR